MVNRRQAQPPAWSESRPPLPTTRPPPIRTPDPPPLPPSPTSPLALALALPSSHPDDRAIFALAAPSFLALAADPLLGMADTALVGRGDPAALAALGVDGAVLNLVFVALGFVGVTTTPLVAGACARGGLVGRREAGAVVWRSLCLAVALGAGAWLAVAAGAPSILRVAGLTDPAALASSLTPLADPGPIDAAVALPPAPSLPSTLDALDVPLAPASVWPQALAYLRARAPAAPAVLALGVCLGALRGAGDARAPLAVAVGGNALHVALVWLLVWHLGRGVAGAGEATAVTEWVSAAAALALLAGVGSPGGEEGEGGGRPEPAVSLWPPPTPAELGRAGGGPVGLDASADGARPAAFGRDASCMLLRTTLLLGTKAAAAASAAHLGPASLAAHQVVAQLWQLASFSVDSLAVAGQTLVAARLAVPGAAPPDAPSSPGREGGAGPEGPGVAPAAAAPSAYGGGDGLRAWGPRGARRVADRLLGLGFGSGLALAAAALLTRDVTPGLFTQDPAVAAEAAPALRVAALSIPICALAYVVDGVAVGAGDYPGMAISMAAASTGAGVALWLNGGGGADGGVAVAGAGGGTLAGVWVALSLLQVLRVVTLGGRVMGASGRLGPREGGRDEGFPGDGGGAGPS